MKAVTDKNGNPVPNLFIRNNRIYLRKNILGVGYLRAAPVRRLADGVPTQESIRMALAWAKAFEDGVLRGETERMTRKRVAATVGQLCDAYARACHANGSPLASTVEANIQAIYRILRAAGYKSPADESTEILSKETLRAYQTATLAKRGDRPATRRTIASTVNQARCVTQERLAQDYPLNLPDLDPWRNAYLGTPPVKETPLPPYELRRRTASAARRLWLSRDPMYAVYLLAYHAGLRSDEIACARWSWIEEHFGVKRIALRDREAEGWHIKGVRPGNVPMHPAVLKRLRVVGGSDYILRGSDYNERKAMIDKSFAAWMTGLGWDQLDTTKRAHELRRLFGSRVWAKYGKEECFMRMRHMSFSTTERHYLNLNLDLRRRELAGI